MSKKGWDLYGNQGDSEMKNRMIEKQNRRYWVSGADSGHSLTVYKPNHLYIELGEIHCTSCHSLSYCLRYLEMLKIVMIR